MDDINKTDKANEQLVNWSKWLITINVFADTGCILGLKTAGAAVERTGVFFFFAILSFSLSIICATLFVYLIARQGLTDGGKDTTKYIWLAKFQWVLFTAGLVFVSVWIGFLSKVF